MQVFATIITLFVTGSILGWIIELFFRRFVSQKRWVNPGFMTGPYLPIYGFGTLGLYVLSELFKLIPNESVPDNLIWLLNVGKVLAIGLILTLVELIAGLIFTKLLNIKLWDYSDRKFNFKGIICPLFSLIWTAVGAIYFFLIHDSFVSGLQWLAKPENNIFYVIVGIVLGMMIVDFCYSAHVATAITKFAHANKVIVKLEDLRNAINKNGKKHFFFIQKDGESFNELIKKIPGITKISEKKKEKKEKDSVK